MKEGIIGWSQLMRFLSLLILLLSHCIYPLSFFANTPFKYSTVVHPPYNITKNDDLLLYLILNKLKYNSGSGLDKKKKFKTTATQK